MWYLAIVVAATIVLYYELYIGGAVSPSIIAGYGMTFPFYVYISVVGNAIGALGSLAAGLSDRWGRANLVAYGLVVTALLILIGILPGAYAHGLGGWVPGDGVHRDALHHGHGRSIVFYPYVELRPQHVDLLRAHPDGEGAYRIVHNVKKCLSSVQGDLTRTLREFDPHP